MKKKKNESRGTDRPTFIRIATGLVLILIFGIAVLFNTIIQHRRDDPFERTSLAPGPNLTVEWLLVQTEIAITEQFMPTSTALP